MSVAVTYASTLTAVETLTNNVPDAAAPIVTHSGFNSTASLGPATTPPVSKMASFQEALSAGAATIDLTALNGTNGASVTFNGLKVAAVKFQNPAGNANAITVKAGASNGYLLHGASWSIILQPGEEYLWKAGVVNAAPTVGSTLKNIDLAGTGSQALNVILIAG
jgi:hypothetical protein